MDKMIVSRLLPVILSLVPGIGAIGPALAQETAMADGVPVTMEYTFSAEMDVHAAENAAHKFRLLMAATLALYSSGLFDGPFTLVPAVDLSAYGIDTDLAWTEEIAAAGTLPIAGSYPHGTPVHVRGEARFGMAFGDSEYSTAPAIYLSHEDTAPQPRELTPAEQAEVQAYLDSFDGVEPWDDLWSHGD